MSAVVSGREQPGVAAGWGERVLQGALTAALAALGFFLLFSTAGTSVALVVLLVVSLFMPGRLWQLRPWRSPLLACGLVLLAYMAACTFVRDGWTAASLRAVNHYHELLLLPLLWALMRVARRPNAFINGLMAGALAFAAMHWLTPVSAEVAWFMHTRRISAGFALAVCAFLFFEHARLRRLPALPGYGAAAFLALTIVFAGDGRTGHLILIVLLACCAWRAAPQRWRPLALLGTIALALLVAAASTPVRTRVTETVAAIQETRSGKLGESSTSMRYELLRAGLDVARQHWLVGTSWTGYPQAFRAAVYARNSQQLLGDKASNPHNEYVLQLGTGGLPALLLFAAWVAIPMVRALRERGSSRDWAGVVGCVALAFACAAFFNSVLLDFVEGHFYTALLAWLMVRRTGE